jgi:hypothetical protein
MTIHEQYMQPEDMPDAPDDEQHEDEQHEDEPDALADLEACMSDADAQPLAPLAPELISEQADADADADNESTAAPEPISEATIAVVLARLAGAREQMDLAADELAAIVASLSGTGGKEYARR